MWDRLNKIITVSMLIVIGLFITTILLDTNYEKKMLKKQLDTLDNSVKEEYKKRLKESVDHTIAFIEASHNTHIKYTQSKKLNEELIVNDLKSYLYNSIFEKSRYTWVNKILDYKGGDNYAIRLIHPNLKNTEGKLLSTNTTDIKGNKPYLEELEGIKKNNELYFTYFFKQLNKDEITQKLSYAKLYKKYNWVIATGIPLNDLNAIIQKKKEILEENSKNHLMKSLLVKFIIMTLFVITLFIVRKKLKITLEKNEELNEKLAIKLKTAETKLDKFSQLPLNILFICDFNSQLLETNNGWRKVLGYKEEMQNKNILDLIHPSDKQKVKDELDKLQSKEMILYFETRIKASDGSYKTFMCSANSLLEESLIYVAAQDITELKDKTNMMYQQSKMAAMGEMIANIAHQWKQPLSVISTASSGIKLKKELNCLDDESLDETIDQITNSTKYLSHTIDDFRDFFNPDKKKSEFGIKCVFDKTFNLIKKRFESNGVEIIQNIEELNIKSYENELLQVLINILNNARDQLVKKEIEKKLIFINAYKKENKIFIDITDNANGVDENIINRIFEPYFTTKHQSQGTGIGLYMSEEIVTKHLNGLLYVKNVSYEYKNENYTGAKFTIELDISQD